MKVACTTLILFGLAACAGARAPTSSSPFYPTQAELDQQCVARGGVLAPTGRNTGRPPLDFTCRVSSANPSSRVQR